jgi:hypothetical protein
MIPKDCKRLAEVDPLRHVGPYSWRCFCPILAILLARQTSKKGRAKSCGPCPAALAQLTRTFARL